LRRPRDRADRQPGPSCSEHSTILDSCSTPATLEGKAALVFYWPGLRRQVRVEGRVVKVSPRESDSYFSGRPRDSQLSAWASQQGRVVRDRRFLEESVKRFGEKYPGRVPRPPNWGGYRLRPTIFEFWKERPGRLHDRLRYRRSNGRWMIERLAP